MASVTVTMSGFPELNARIRQIGENVPGVVATAMYEEAQSILTDAVTNYVPFDTGTLANSGRVDAPEVSPQSVSVTLGFGGMAAPYAIAVHENPRAGQTGGVSPQGKPYKHFARRGQWKYLEEPLKQHAPQVGEALRVALDALAQEKSV